MSDAGSYWRNWAGIELAISRQSMTGHSQLRPNTYYRWRFLSLLSSLVWFLLSMLCTFFYCSSVQRCLLHVQLKKMKPSMSGCVLKVETILWYMGTWFFLKLTFEVDGPNRIFYSPIQFGIFPLHILYPFSYRKVILKFLNKSFLMS